MEDRDADLNATKSATYIVSGGASRPGRCDRCGKLASAGHHVIIGDSDERAAAEVADELNGSAVAAYRCDVRSDQDLKGIVEFATRDLWRA